MAALTPLPGRECGECTACCVELDIDAPDLKKPDGAACPHMIPAAGCGIFAGRPSLCRHWYCGWRIMAVSDALRPDRSGILLTPEMGDRPGYQAGGLRVVLIGGDRAALRNRELIDLIARCVMRRTPIWLSWGGGAKAKRYLVNGDLTDALAAADQAAFHRALDAALTGLIADVEGSGEPV